MKTWKRRASQKVKFFIIGNEKKKKLQFYSKDKGQGTITMWVIYKYLNKLSEILSGQE